MRNCFLFDKVQWVRYPILSLLICSASNVAAESSSPVLDSGIQPATVTTNNYGVESVQQNRRTRTIVGTVIDKTDNSPLIGANIMVTQTKTGVITDVDGRFSVTIPEKGATIEVSYIGYKTQKIAVNDQGVLNVYLDSDNEMLNEVVVVGAGTQKKISVTGAISNIEGSALTAPSSSLTSNFAGKLAGVISRTTSGEPGSTSEFYIRGAGTFGGRATPLIICDGVEISTGDLNRIPSETIESFSILKDASATAIYGARGANGVMVLTTKSGEENTATRIHVSVENSFVKPTNQIEYVDGATWMETYNEAQFARDPKAITKYSDEAIELTRSGKYPLRYPDVDWYDLMFKEMMMNQRANVNISGGGTRATYYMSLQANHDTGMLDVPKSYSFDNNIDRWNYNFQSNVGYKLTSTTKVDLRLNAQFGTNKGTNSNTGDFFKAAYNTSPIAFPAVFPAQEGDKHIRFGNAFLSGSELVGNPYAQMLSNYKEENYSTLNASLSLNQDLKFITKGLKFKVLVNMKTWAQQSYRRWVDPYYYGIADGSWAPDENGMETYELTRIGSSGNNYVSEADNGKNTDRTIYVDARLDYNRSFGKHAVSGMLMYMQREYRSGTIPNRNQGLSGRFTYDYDNRYLVEFNFGYNGSERLAKGERFEFFPAASVGWVVSGEEFWKPIEKYINLLKLRGSYGIVGSDETGENKNGGESANHFLYLDKVTIGSGGGFYLGAGPHNGDYRKGPGFHQYATQDACWERVYKLDIGVDIELFNQFRITADYFHDKREKILMKRASWPRMLGYSDAIPWSNVGKVDNSGFDLSVNWKTQPIKDMWVDVRANFTYNKNKYVYKDEPEYPYVWKTETGKPLNRRLGYICDGFFESQAEIDNAPSQLYGKEVLKVGDLKYRDVNGDGTINSDDQVMISPYGSTPRIQWGTGLNITYKNWDFGIFFNGSAKRSIMINKLEPFGTAIGTSEHNLMKFIADNHYSLNDPDNFNVLYPRLGITSDQTKHNMVESSFWLRNGNFVRFKTLEFGYTFKKKYRIYFSADNLAVWSKFKEWDPELNWDSYPLSQTFNIGAQFKF